MAERTTTLRCWPSSTQRLLLIAALEEDEVARTAWHRWRARVDLAAIDAASFRLLPLLYRNLARLGVEDAILPRLRGVYRHSWYQNQLLLHRLEDVLKTLHAAGVQTLVHKGVALTLQCYHDMGARPTVDMDVLVPTTQAEHAIRALLDAGWTAQAGDPFRLLQVRHATPFCRGDRSELDLHWSLLVDSSGEQADQDFWAGAVVLATARFATRTLNPTDHLLQAMAHGILCCAGTAQIRWIADAVWLIRGQPVDWHRLLDQATKKRVTLPVREALLYLDAHFSVGIPSAVLRQLRARPVSWLERIELRARANGALTETWWVYARRHPGDSLWTRVRRLPRFLQQTWGTGSAWDTIRVALRKTANRITTRTVGPGAVRRTARSGRRSTRA